MQNCAQCGTPLPYDATTCPGCGNFVAYNSPSWGSYSPSNDAPASNHDVAQLPFPSSGPSYGPPSQAGLPPYTGPISPSAPSYNPASQPLQPPYTGPVSPSAPSYNPSSLSGQPAYPPYTGPISPSAPSYNPASQPLQPPYGSGAAHPSFADFDTQTSVQQQSPHYSPSFPNASSPNYGPPPVQPAQPPVFAAQGQPGNRASSGHGGRSLSKGMVVSVAVLTFLLIASGISLILYTTVLHPAQLQAHASATARAIADNNAHASATANSYITATAQVSATVQAKAQATANAIEATYAQSTNRAPSFSSTMAFQDQGNWDTYNAVGGGGCSFMGGALHSSIAQKQFYVPCFAQATNFTDFVFEVQMTILKGDEGGLIFRANDTASKFYYFRIGRDGIYSLNVSKDDKHSTPLLFDTSSAIKTGAGQANLVTVIAKGPTIYLYINKHFVGSARDTSYNAGKIGVFAGDNHTATDVAFSNARVWQL